MKRVITFTSIAAFSLVLLFPGCISQKVSKEKQDPGSEELLKIGDIHPDGGIIFDIDKNLGNGLVCQTKNLGAMNWGDAIKACKELGDGWRLPTKDELNLMYTNLYLKSHGGIASGLYWSSTERNDNVAWGQAFADGLQTGIFKESNATLVRAVREIDDITKPETNEKTGFKIGDFHKGGIVFFVDESGEQGLISHNQDLEYYTWDEAVQACKGLGDGWRLPTKDELDLMYENLYKKDLGGLSGSPYSSYWSSTEIDSDGAWSQTFSDGDQFESFKDQTNYARAVRAF